MKKLLLIIALSYSLTSTAQTTASMRTVRGGLFIEVKTNSEAVLQKALELHKEKIAYYLVWYKNKKNEKSEYISLFFFSKYKKEVVEFIK